MLSFFVNKSVIDCLDYTIIIVISVLPSDRSLAPSYCPPFSPVSSFDWVLHWTLRDMSGVSRYNKRVQLHFGALSLVRGSPAHLICIN